MSTITLYHNPRCSKSRGALERLEASGVDLEVVEYLKTPLTAAELEALMARLPDPPPALVRQDAHFRELGLDASAYVDAAAVAALLAEHPQLMQRPIAVRGERAVIGRPPEAVEALLTP